MPQNSLSLYPKPIKFGTDGWRGILGDDFTVDNLKTVSIAAAQELHYRSKKDRKKQIIVGYDRRFLAKEMAEVVASAIRGCGLQPLMSDQPVPTPACSLAALQLNCLGALIVTASHNPPEWLGLKIKGPEGGSVDESFTESVQRRLLVGGITAPIKARNKLFNCRSNHLNTIKEKFDIKNIISTLKDLKLKIFVDPMHGSASNCISDLFGEDGKGLIHEIRTNEDPLFGGNPPEPVEKYLSAIIQKVCECSSANEKVMGLIFDGDGDRLAAVDEFGRYCSTQLLMPLLIDHMAKSKKEKGCVIKTVSCCDLMSSIATNYGLEVLEKPVGFKYIAKEFAVRDVLIGGEESGGIGFGGHIPERDGIYTALVILEAIAQDKTLLGAKLNSLQEKFGSVNYERMDLKLANSKFKEKIEYELINNPPTQIGDYIIREISLIDGVKLRIDDNFWIMFRFSGTEPLLRIYCETPDKNEIKKSLLWAEEYILNIQNHE